MPDVSWFHQTSDTMYDNDQFQSPTFLFNDSVMSSKRVAQEKIISWNRFLFY